MKLITLKADTPDGRLAVLSQDTQWMVEAKEPCTTLQAALEQWDRAGPALRALYGALNAGKAPDAVPYNAQRATAPMPRSFQWLDGSAFLSHGDLMSRVFHIDNPQTDRPLMYQGMSHEFLGATDDVSLPSEADGIDFEGEFGVITGEVPMGVSAGAAAEYIRLVIQINDWSLRTLGAAEMKTGFGWVQGKPACSVAPIALTPDELGAGWERGRVALPLHVRWNDRPFGAALGSAMGFSFPELIAHAARTRRLCAGTIIGSGTVSNDNYREVGSSCIAERRAIELLDTGEPRTAYMRFGDRVRMAAVDPAGRMPFGVIDQRVVASG